MYLKFQLLFLVCVFDRLKICLVLHLWRFLQRIKVLPYVVIILLGSVALGLTRKSGALRSLLRSRSLFLFSGHHDK